MTHINAAPNANADLSGSDAVNAPVANPNNTANMRFSRFAFLSPICYHPPFSFIHPTLPNDHGRSLPPHRFVGREYIPADQLKMRIVTKGC